MMRTALHVTLPREGRTSGTFTELQRTPQLPTAAPPYHNGVDDEDALAEGSPRLTCSPLMSPTDIELPDKCISIDAKTKIMTAARSELYTLYKARKKEERKASAVAAAEVAATAAAAAAATATTASAGLREKSPSMGNVINNYTNDTGPDDTSKKSEKRSGSQTQKDEEERWPQDADGEVPDEEYYNDGEGEEEVEDEEAKAQEQRILQTAPRRMQFQNVSVGPHYHETFASVVLPRVNTLIDFVATGGAGAGAMSSPLRYSNASLTRELSDGGTPKIDDHYSFLEDDCASNDGRIPETIKSETIFLYGNSSTDRDGLFAFFLRHTAELLHKRQKSVAPGSGEGGDATFSVIDIYENWGVGDVLDAKDDMHGNGKVRRRSQWSAKAKKRVRHATRRAVSTLLEDAGAEGTPKAEGAAAGEHGGLYAVLGTIDAPGTLRDNPEGQAHHHTNAALVWTYYWTSACYDPAYIPGNTSYDETLPVPSEAGDGSAPVTPHRGSTPPVYSNAVFREGRLHFVLLPNAELKDQSPKSAEELHALSVALKALAAAHHGPVVGDDEPEKGKEKKEAAGDDEGDHSHAAETGDRSKVEEDQAAMLACGTPVHEVSETDADFQCRAAIRDSPLLSYLAAVPQSAYSAALWDGAGSAVCSRATSPSVSAANSPRRSICGSVRSGRSGRSMAESVQSCVSIADLSGSKARERLRQTLGHISLLACLHSGWEQYLEARAALHFLYRCLNLSVPPPSPPPRQQQQLLELGASSPDVKLPRGEEEGHISGESDEARLQSIHSQSARGTEAPERSPPMEVPEEGAVRDALDSTVASEVSARVKQPYRRSTTCSPDVDTDAGSKPREEGSRSPIQPTALANGSFNSPLLETVNRFLSDEFLSATDRRCRSAPPRETVVAALRPLEVAVLSAPADAANKENNSDKEESFFDKENLVGASRHVESPTAIARVNHTLDKMFQDNQAKQAALEQEQAKASEVYVETLKTYTGCLIVENEQLRGCLAGRPQPPSPSAKYLEHLVLQGGEQSPVLPSRSPHLFRQPLSVRQQQQQQQQHQHQQQTEEDARESNSSFFSNPRKASLLHPYNGDNEDNGKAAAAAAATSSIGTPISFFAKGVHPPMSTYRYINYGADAFDSDLHPTEQGVEENDHSSPINSHNNNNKSKEDLDALQPLVQRLLQVGQRLFLQTEGEQRRRSSSERLHLFKSILTTLIDQYKVAPDAMLDRESSSESEEQEQEVNASALEALKDAAEKKAGHPAPLQEGEEEKEEPALPVLHAEEVEAPIVLVGMSDFQARLRLLDRSLAASFEVFLTAQGQQVHTQQLRVDGLQDELQRLRMRCAAYEEKFTFLREHVHPQVRRDAQELELRAAERQRLQAKRNASQQAALAEVEARLARLAEDVKSW